jgi:predicted Ser/Thr protein kinase
MEQMERIGRYKVEGVIGSGAAGVVYLGRDPVIGRKLALKTLRTDLPADTATEMRQRFVREAKVAGRISHPNIVTVFDAGEDAETGIAFIAMEYLEGQTLQAVIEAENRLEPRRVIELGVPLASALDHAHRKGVVHRDLKPSNIMFTADGLVKITDYGIARLEASALTALGTVMGTPYYMSPEQVLGKKAEPRSDIYSLGAVLFQLLTGFHPFKGESLPTQMTAILQQPAPNPLELRTDAPPELAEIILRCLAKAPEDRFQTSRELQDALEAVDLDEPDKDPEATVRRWLLPPRRHPAYILDRGLDGRPFHIWWRTELIIGREPACDIALPDGAVSRRHGVLYLTDEGARYLDLASVNGTLRNGVAVDGAAFLTSGDVLGFGPAGDLGIRVRHDKGVVTSLMVTGPQAEHVLARGDVLLGSDPYRSDIVLAGPEVAPIHARLGITEDAVVVSALSADQPIMVDGQEASSFKLGERHRLQIGDTTLDWLRS